MLFCAIILICLSFLGTWIRSRERLGPPALSSHTTDSALAISELVEGQPQIVRQGQQRITTITSMTADRSLQGKHSTSEMTPILLGVGAVWGWEWGCWLGLLVQRKGMQGKEVLLYFSADVARLDMNETHNKYHMLRE